MRAKKITIKDDSLRSKKATEFINKASEYSSSIYLEMNNKRINAKSIIGVLSLNVAEGDEIRLLVDGQDEDAAIEGICGLLGV